jgi:hypothetical protein
VITSMNASSVSVRLNAQDQGSEQKNLRMRVSTNERFTGAAWQPFKATASVQRSGGGAVRVYAQFEDAAGNLSTVVSATPSQQPTPTRTGGPTATPTQTTTTGPTATPTRTTEPGEWRTFLPLVRQR